MKLTLSRRLKLLLQTAVLAAIGIVCWLVFLFPYEVTSSGEKRLKNLGSRFAAETLSRQAIVRAEFVFWVDESEMIRARAFETDQIRIAEILSAFKKASRSTEVRLEPGTEAEIQDKVTFFLARRDETRGFSLHRDDLDQRWGPEIKAIWQKYRKIAKIEKPSEDER